MPAYSLTRLAESDLRSIIQFTMKTWGMVQTKRYTHGLRNCFELLANNPALGRSCDSISPGLHRFEHGRHVVFYLSQPEGLLIVRVLHQQMIPSKHYFER